MHHMKTEQLPLIPAQKPIRVTVPVAPDVLEAFKRLAAASGVSVGKAMGDWLADTVDGVGYMTDLLEKARKAPQLAVRELHAYAIGLTDSTTELLEGIRRTTGKQVVDGAAGAVGRQPIGGDLPHQERVKDSLPYASKPFQGPLTPPVSNTGGKVSGERKQKPSKAPFKTSSRKGGKP
jgi:hypothetical protein